MLFSLRMEPIRKTPRGPPIGYEIGPHRYFTVAESTRIIGYDLICEKTLWILKPAMIHLAALTLE